jgi:hypothetical protein
MSFSFPDGQEWIFRWMDVKNMEELRTLAMSYRSQCYDYCAQLRRLKAEMEAKEKENGRLRLAAQVRRARPAVDAPGEPSACVAGDNCQCCSALRTAEARASSAEALLAEVLARHTAVLEVVRGQGSERLRRYLRRNGVLVFNL